MQFAKKVIDNIPIPLVSNKATEEDFEHLNNLREKYSIKIDKVKFVTFLDYVQSLDLDPGLFNMVQHNKDNLGAYIHFFDIELENATIEKSSLKWTIRRRLLDFLALEAKLNQELVETLKIPKSYIPQFSDFYDTNSVEVPEEFIKGAEAYLRKLLETPEVRAKSKAFYEFIELSLLPLPNGPQKYKEGRLKKRGGGRFKQNKVKLYMDNIIANWQHRWFTLTEEGIIYAVDSTSTKAREILLFDQTFQILYGEKATGLELGIFLVTPNRRLHLEAHDVFEALDWIGEIQKIVKSSPYTKINRFMSFAPAREANHFCKWYVDACGYYSDLCDALLKAQKEIFITDWWLSPEIPLKRPVQDGESEFRLDKVLGKVANAGVKIYVVLYHEVKMMMYNDSDHAKKVLQSMSPNITVLQHPSEPFFNWSHHEKLVIIDQTVGFIGGLDLCFGRWDTREHSIKDPAFEEGKGETFFGQDYVNPRLVDFRNVAEQHNMSLISKQMIPRMPFHDAMIQVMGPVVGDMSRHFIQYYNHVTVDCYGKQEEAPLPRNSLVSPRDEDALRRERVIARFHSALRKIFLIRHMGGASLAAPSQDVHNIPKVSGPVNQPKTHVQEQVEASIRASIRKAPSVPVKEEQKEGEGDALMKEKHGSTTEVRGSKRLLSGLMDKGISLIGNALDRTVNIPILGEFKPQRVVENLTGRRSSVEEREYGQKYAELLQNIKEKEKKETNPSNPSQSTEPKLHKHQHIKNLIKGEEKFEIKETDQKYEKGMLQILFTPKMKIKDGTIACQMVRSASKWSLGLNSNDGNVENSIQNAYIEIIKNAKHFIYIENQFFMSSTAGGSLKNEVAKALLYRIEKAHAMKERFRVIVFLPLLPAFEGEIVDSKSALLKIQMHWQYMTICRGGTSIYEELARKGIEAIDYIQFYSLRTHAIMPSGEPASELIYIHSKILIADDDILLIGSANINDRSLQGSGDSEVAMIFEDSKKVKSYMNGQEVRVSEFVHSFRTRILSEHLGLSEKEVQDPLTDHFIVGMDEITERNTLIYREVFACYPDDNVRTVKDIDEFEKRKNLSKYAELSKNIQGHVVWFPLDFMCDEKLTAPLGSIEHFIPDKTFI